MKQEQSVLPKPRNLYDHSKFEILTKESEGFGDDKRYYLQVKKGEKVYRAAISEWTYSRIKEGTTAIGALWATGEGENEKYYFKQQS